MKVAAVDIGRVNTLIVVFKVEVDVTIVNIEKYSLNNTKLQSLCSLKIEKQLHDVDIVIIEEQLTACNSRIHVNQVYNKIIESFITGLSVGLKKHVSFSNSKKRHTNTLRRLDKLNVVYPIQSMYTHSYSKRVSCILFNYCISTNHLIIEPPIAHLIDTMSKSDDIRDCYCMIWEYMEMKNNYFIIN